MPAAKRTIGYQRAQRIVRALRLRSRTEWRVWVRSNRDFLDRERIPSRPDIRYKGKEWIDWHHWLGATRSAKALMLFEDWQAWVRSEPSITSKQTYIAWCTQHKDERAARSIPFSPAYSYGSFPGWRAVLNKSPDSNGKERSSYAPFAQVRRWARSQKLSKAEAWRIHAKERKTDMVSKGYPAAPDRVAAYRENWRGWKDFLGTDKRPVKNYKQ